MANEKLTIQENNARLTVIGRSYPDESTDSGPGPYIIVELIEDLIDLDIDLPDIEDWEDIDVIPGFDEDGQPLIIYIDPETDDIIDWPLDIDPNDFQDLLDSLDFDIYCPDIEISGLDINGITSVVTTDDDLKIKVDNLPAGIQIVTLPKKLIYIEGKTIDITGMVVKAINADGSTWTSAKYPNGHIPLGELIIDPNVATEDGEMLYNTFNGFFCNVSSSAYDRTFTQTAYGDAFAGMAITSDGWYTPFIVSDVESFVRLHCEDVKSPSFTMDSGPSGSAIIRGLRVYYYWGYGLKEGQSGSGVGGTGITVFAGSLSDVLEAIVSGEGKGKVAVRWLRPGDGQELWTSFEVDIYPRGNGGR